MAVLFIKFQNTPRNLWSTHSATIIFLSRTSVFVSSFCILQGSYEPSQGLWVRLLAWMTGFYWWSKMSTYVLVTFLYIYGASVATVFIYSSSS